jgi:polygalacturonase
MRNDTIHSAGLEALALLITVAALATSVTSALADPPLPVFGPAVYDVTHSNPSVNGGIPASIGSSDNATAINAFISYCSSHGGGTVELPSGTFLSGTIVMQSNVNLQIDNGGILRNTSINNTLITSSGSTSNMQISGSGILDGNATTAISNANLVQLKNVTTLAIVGVTIENAAHEHLVPENDTNVTINGVTIKDPGTLAANQNSYLANTDGIDYSGSNYLIKNCNISCGDDNIVAKPAGTACNNIKIIGCSIGAGHGISVGGGSASGLSNMTVSNCTFNGTDNGLRLKAQDALGGDAGGGPASPVKNVAYKNITMTNVKHPIVIDNFYNGNNNFPSSPTDSTHYPSSPTAVGSTTPMWENISFENVTAIGSADAGLLYGLNSTPNNVEGLSFTNVSISAASHMNLWYASAVDLSGLTVTVPNSDPFANANPVQGVYTYGLTSVTTAPVLLPGDFNRDGQVNVADISAMLGALVGPSGFSQSDWIKFRGDRHKRAVRAAIARRIDC